jgi:hypothetical protein
MSIGTLLSELWAYAHTKEYREGLFVEASGLILDVLLLIVGVKVIAYYLARQSRSTTKFASSFFIAQFLRETLLLQLKSGGVPDANGSLRAAFEARQLESLFSHIYYGNTENLLDLLRIRMRTGEHIGGHLILTSEQRLDIAKEARSLLVKLDNLLVMLASLRQEEQCLRAYEFRLVLTAVFDYLERLSKSKGDPPHRTYAPISTALASGVDSWFKSCQKVLDRQLKNRIRWSYARLLLSLPKVAAYRFFVRKWQRFRGRPYTDPFDSNFPQLFCRSLERSLGIKWGEVIAASGINEDDFSQMAAQHVPLSQDACIAFFSRIRSFVPAGVWNRLLAEVLIADVDGRSISVATVDATKAKALYYLTSLASKDENTAQLIEQTFQSFWNLRPSSV